MNNDVFSQRAQSTQRYCKHREHREDILPQSALRTQRRFTTTEGTENTEVLTIEKEVIKSVTIR